jgi:hypothetical protein
LKLWRGTVTSGVAAAVGVAGVGSPSIISTSLAQDTSSESMAARYGLAVTDLTKTASAAGSEVQSAETVPSALIEALARAHAQAAAASFLAAAVE